MGHFWVEINTQLAFTAVEADFLSNDTACRYRFLKFRFPSAFCTERTSMPASNTVIRDICARLNALHVNERELELRFFQEISTAHAHYGPSILALDSADPQHANFMTLYYQLALRRIEQFKQEISERAYCLNYSLAVQEALRLLGVRTALQCDLGIELGHDSSCSKEESVQQINMAFLHLMMCNKSLLNQLKELTHYMEEWINGKATRLNQGVSQNSLDSCKTT